LFFTNFGVATNLKAMAGYCFQSLENDSSKFKVVVKNASNEFLLALSKEYFGNCPSAFETNTTLDKLAQKAGVGSATQVRRLLIEAEYRGLVTIQIQEDPRADSEVLKGAFGLKDVYICGDRDQVEPIRVEIGNMLASYFDKIINHKGFSRVAIGGGRTLHAMVGALQEKDRPISIAPLSFFSQDDLTLHSRSPLMDAPFLAMAMAWKSKCTPLICAIPPLPDAPADCKKFTAKQFELSPTLNRAFSQACDAEIILTSASQLEPASHLVQQYALIGVSYARLVELGCIGHINYCPIDSNGCDLSDQLTEQKNPNYPEGCHPFLAAIKIDRIRSTAKNPGKNVILAAAGPGKAIVIESLLASGTVNTLFTDSGTARLLRNNLQSKAIP
jgi:DNA-binding transcriptional regulator LsrR (DeoR family)